MSVSVIAKSFLQEDLEPLRVLSAFPQSPVITLARLVELHEKLVVASQALHAFTERAVGHEFHLVPKVKTPMELVQEDVDAYILQQAVDQAEKAYAEGIADFAALQ